MKSFFFSLFFSISILLKKRKKKEKVHRYLTSFNYKSKQKNFLIFFVSVFFSILVSLGSKWTKLFRIYICCSLSLWDSCIEETRNSAMSIEIPRSCNSLSPIVHGPNLSSRSQLEAFYMYSGVPRGVFVFVLCVRILIDR